MDAIQARSVIDGVDGIDFRNNRDIRLQRLNVKSSFGTMYESIISGVRLIFKYQWINTDNLRTMWEIEQRNNQYINENLENNPDLPYPYTFKTYQCGPIRDISHLIIPVCPFDGIPSVGISVHQYIDSIGSLTGDSLQLMLEAVATLAEAHQGDTVIHHFMHLDSKPDNFLISRTSTTREVGFDGFIYHMGTTGYQLNLIDYGFSHFLDDEEQQPRNADIPNGTVLGNELYPAFDLITLIRNLLPKLFGRMFNELSGLVKITALMFAEQIIGLLKARIRRRHLFKASNRPSELKPECLSEQLYSLYTQRNSLEDVQLFLCDYTDRFIADVISRGKLGTDHKLIIFLLSGYYMYRNPYSSTLEGDRTLYQRKLEPLPDTVLLKLGISKVSMTGIPLYLWYNYMYGVEMPI